MTWHVHDAPLRVSIYHPQPYPSIIVSPPSRRTTTSPPSPDQKKKRHLPFHPPPSAELPLPLKRRKDPSDPTQPTPAPTPCNPPSHLLSLSLSLYLCPSLPHPAHRPTATTTPPVPAKPTTPTPPIPPPPAPASRRVEKRMQRVFRWALRNETRCSAVPCSAARRCIPRRDTARVGWRCEVGR